ncbi:hypothetical protein BS47DRAFT_1338055 [Hydnum rufescens UP504]|uniref:Uncharacterized protein n=1 Tax=Hydnum rufescens UP504 TaxID=1448309 RepID=A0A9P6B374_9AGAM|nr:hypothetical protein BS47DRAFT_1340182 [Hydnum rufescens UP504]KAF9518844.1 hypothetical protein BS47DRAFT_1338055 [Hydnum rufescens UP504]
MVLRNYQERAMTRMRETSGVHPLDEPRRALEVESGAFLLVMQKSSLVVQPKIMQAQEYGLTKERIMITPKPRRTPGSHRGSFSLSPTITDPEVIPI